MVFINLLLLPPLPLGSFLSSFYYYYYCFSLVLSFFSSSRAFAGRDYFRRAAVTSPTTWPNRISKLKTNHRLPFIMICSIHLTKSFGLIELDAVARQRNESNWIALNWIELLYKRVRVAIRLACYIKMIRTDVVNRIQWLFFWCWAHLRSTRLSVICLSLLIRCDCVAWGRGLHHCHFITFDLVYEPRAV